MPHLWDAFLEDYYEEIWDWSLRLTLEIFWHYCQDGQKGVHKFFDKKEQRRKCKAEAALREAVKGE
jgi:hypothetical protein